METSSEAAAKTAAVTVTAVAAVTDQGDLVMYANSGKEIARVRLATRGWAHAFARMNTASAIAITTTAVALATAIVAFVS